jgi:hypothetical protein
VKNAKDVVTRTCRGFVVVTITAAIKGSRGGRGGSAAIHNTAQLKIIIAKLKALCSLETDAYDNGK